MSKKEYLVNIQGLCQRKVSSISSKSAIKDALYQTNHIAYEIVENNQNCNCIVTDSKGNAKKYLISVSNMQSVCIVFKFIYWDDNNETDTPDLRQTMYYTCGLLDSRKIDALEKHLEIATGILDVARHESKEDYINVLKDETVHQTKFSEESILDIYGQMKGQDAFSDFESVLKKLQERGYIKLLGKSDVEPNIQFNHCIYLRYEDI
jgi:hypothetical protein